MRDSSRRLRRLTRRSEVQLLGLRLTRRVVSLRDVWPHAEPERSDTAPVLLLTLAGELDFVNGPALLPHLLELVAQNERVCCDLLPLTFIDTHGAQPLIRGRQAALDAGRRFWVSRASAQVRTILVYAGGEGLLSP